MQLLSVRIPGKLYRTLKAKSKQLEDENLSFTIRRLLEFALEAYEVGNKNSIKKNELPQKIYNLLEVLVRKGVKNGDEILSEAEKMSK